ncbi:MULTISPECIES: alpha/beta fold hydrolase [Dethiosulfovibrio]|uniref:Alpha/beta hydrolase n=2 Tax=Dethiosulfovibrio TaxID=47054 RepID=A0ABS9EUI4_9BACT|nr:MULTISPECIES: alpha/beta hydrolase [Dethiosulfovibrio]MCF4115078.1 alpha/beta hydrolase [Dethiosulfovibrio russensis]MCF4143480.1 alpha/beta hydrolase [Dethiosulfovibrio marinus]MCF4145705.1 alpha/beta hydrolase [Dethiosulfovibrio acidaminovorans]
MSQSFRTARIDDVSLAYTVAGQGEPLLLIMGFGGTMDFWGFPFVSTLMKKFKVIAFDNRGVGESSIGTEPPSIDRFASDAAGLLDHLGIESAHVLGWSMGGYVAQELTLARPELVRDLVLYGTCCDHRNVMELRPGASGNLMNTSVSDVERTEIALNMLFPRPWLDSHPGFEKAFLSRPMTVYSRCAEGIAGQVKAIASWKGCCDRVPSISVSTMVVAGEMDGVIPASLSRELAKALPDGSFRSFSDGGHGLVYQYPKELAEMVTEFLP